MGERSILLVTYNLDERRLYGHALSNAGFEVQVCAAHALVARAATERPAAIVTRVLQPGCAMDGLELTRVLKRTPATASIPVIIMTSAFAAMHYREAAEAAGCDDYLLLPLMPDELVAAVNRLVAFAR